MPFVCGYVCPKIYYDFGSLLSHREIHNADNIIDSTLAELRLRNQREVSRPFMAQETENSRKSREVSTLKGMNADAGVYGYEKGEVSSQGEKGVKEDSVLKESNNEDQNPQESRIIPNNSSYTSELYKHQNTTTEKQKFMCKVCEKSFDLKDHLEQHKTIHAGEKNFECINCNHRFTQKGRLIRHIRVKTGERPCECKNCNGRFTQKCSLVIHMREKHIVCRICDAEFPAMSSLIRHMRKHTREKPFECTKCNKRFSQTFNLTTHMRKHIGEDPFNVTNLRGIEAQSNLENTYSYTY